MDEKMKWFDKGLYHHPQAAGFVSLKQYMIVENKGKHCLMLRFFNELKVAVSAIEFRLTQLDVNGTALGSAIIKVDSMSMAPGTTHAMKSGIVISEKCADFRVTVISATSNGYKYVLRHGVPMPTYDLRRGKTKLTPRESARSVTSKISTKGKFAATALSIAILIATGVLITYLSLRNFGNFSAQDVKNLFF